MAIYKETNTQVHSCPTIYAYCAMIASVSNRQAMIITAKTDSALVVSPNALPLVQIQLARLPTCKDEPTVDLPSLWSSLHWQRHPLHSGCSGHRGQWRLYHGG